LTLSWSNLWKKLLLLGLVHLDWWLLLCSKDSTQVE
jgi:hypothetical protein